MYKTVQTNCFTKLFYVTAKQCVSTSVPLTYVWAFGFVGCILFNATYELCQASSCRCSCWNTRFVPTQSAWQKPSSSYGTHFPCWHAWAKTIKKWSKLWKPRCGSCDWHCVLHVANSFVSDFRQNWIYCTCFTARKLRNPNSVAIRQRLIQCPHDQPEKVHEHHHAVRVVWCNVCPPTTFNNEHCISKCFWR